MDIPAHLRQSVPIPSFTLTGKMFYLYSLEVSLAAIYVHYFLSFQVHV